MPLSQLVTAGCDTPIRLATSKVDRPAFSMGYSPATRPISHQDLAKHKSIWVRPITPDSFLQDALTGWYEVHDFYVQNQYGTRFLFDTYGTRWLAFEMEF